MASPFRIFRKYQKTLLVVAGVVLMFVFVIGDSLVGYLSGSRGRGQGGTAREATAVAVNWKGNSLTNQELDNLVMRRRIVNQFLYSVEYAGMQSSMEAGLEPRQLTVMPMRGQPTEQSVVTTKIVADAAREAGMRVSDDAIVRYLDELGRQRVSRDEMRAMLNQAGGGRVPIQFVLDALREEMLANNYFASYRFAFRTVTPEQRYEDWLRVNDRVVVEAAALPVATFLIDTPEPTDAELTEFFEKHKEREPQPDFIGQMEFPSPVPGFRVPRKIDVRYLQANYDEFLAKVENEITEEEITKYYEENKDPLFIKADTGLFDEATTTEPPVKAEEEPATPPSTEGQQEPAGEPAEGATSPPSTETPPSPPADSETPPATEPAPPTEPASEPDAGKQSLRQNTQRDLFRLTAFAQEQEEDEPAEEANTAAPAEQNAAAPADSANATTPPATTPAADAAATQTPPAAAATGEPAAQAPAAEEKPKEYQSLDEVRDEIRTGLARERLNERLDELMNQLFSEVNAEFTSFFGSQLKAEEEGREVPKPPASLVDLSALAIKHGLQHGETGPMSWLDMRGTPVGGSGEIDSRSPLYQLLFLTQDIDLHQPIATRDVDGNRFLAMMMSDTPGRIPTLAEVRDQVVRAWKMQKAAELAQKHADGLAKEAQESNKPLADVFAGKDTVEIVRTDPFSRYTGGEVSNLGGQLQQQPFRLSEPEGITAAGPEFMDKVFALKTNEVGAVLNHDHSIVYVVRIAEHQHPPEELRTAFLAEANNWPGLGMMINDHERISSSLLVSSIIDGLDIKWERPADQRQQEPAADE